MNLNTGFGRWPWKLILNLMTGWFSGAHWYAASLGFVTGMVAGGLLGAYDWGLGWSNRSARRSRVAASASARWAM